ncbi:hypothetical protein [Mesorhizobium sp.]|uniref:hypothetical protein n=1 Tax=Mesorhizobium sp. TaxID=1871066 RepID=UPI0025DE1580|nr:hypothetical protein [Mesorhizobium sp.]
MSIDVLRAEDYSALLLGTSPRLKSNLLPVVIQRMDTRNLDLGLLVTLEALLAEGNVTRAGVGWSDPARRRASATVA